MTENKDKHSIFIPITVKGFYYFLHSLFLFFIPIYLVNQGYSGFHIGLFLGLSNFAAIISSLPTGVANDRTKSKRIIFYSLILTILYYFGLLKLSNVILLSLVFIIGGIGKNMFTISIDSLAYRIFDKTKISLHLSRYLGIITFITVIGFIAGGYSVNEFGFHNTITGIIIFLIFTALISLFLPITHTFKFNLFEYKKDILKKNVLLFATVVFLFALHYGAETTSYSLFLKTNFLLDAYQIGLFIGPPIIFLALSQLIFGYKIQKGLNPKGVFYIGLILSGFGHIALSLQSDITLAFIARCIHEFGDGAMILSIYYGIVKIFDIKRIGGNSSLITFTQIIGASVGAFIFGPIGEYYGYGAPLFISGVTTLLSFLLLLHIESKKLQKI